MCANGIENAPRPRALPPPRQLDCFPYQVYVFLRTVFYMRTSALHAYAPHVVQVLQQPVEEPHGDAYTPYVIFDFYGFPKTPDHSPRTTLKPGACKAYTSILSRAHSQNHCFRNSEKEPFYFLQTTSSTPQLTPHSIPVNLGKMSGNMRKPCTRPHICRN